MQGKGVVMRGCLLTGAAAIMLAACAPDLSQVTESYSDAVSGADSAMTEVVAANTRARKRLDYQTIAIDRPLLRIEAACSEIFDLAAWSGGALASPNAAPTKEARQRALTERQDRLARLAEDCAVVTMEQAPAASPALFAPMAPGASGTAAQLRDPFYLCGIDPTRLSLSQEGSTAPDQASTRPKRIPPTAPDTAAQAELTAALEAYANALQEAAEAKDIEALESAATRVADSLSELAALAGPFGVIAAPAVKAVGTAAARLSGLFLREERFDFIKETVNATDGAVQDSVAVICHGALLLSYEIVRSEGFLLNDMVNDYNIARGLTDASFAGDRQMMMRLDAMDGVVFSLRQVAGRDSVAPILGVAESHNALKQAVNDPDPDFAAIVARLKTLIGELEEIRKIAATLAQSR